MRFFGIFKGPILSNFGISAFCVFEGGETARNQTESSRSIFGSFKGQILLIFGIDAFCVFEGGETARNQTESARSIF